MKNLFIFLLTSLSLLSCKKENGKREDLIPAQAFTEVSFGANAAHRMDIYLPANRTTSTTKVIVLIHGGGWNEGDKSDFAPVISIIKQRLPEYAIFNINYRLATGANVFPAQENDIRNALLFIILKAEEYQVNKNQIVLLGVSAGAHLALLHAYKNSSPEIKAVVDFFGPTDLVEMYTRPPNPLIPNLLLSVTGTTPSANLTLYQQSSPINYVSANSPPTLILHGEKDLVVSFSQSTALKNKLQSFGVVHEMVVYPNEGHGWFGASLTHSFDKIVAFLQANVR